MLLSNMHACLYQVDRYIANSMINYYTHVNNTRNNTKYRTISVLNYTPRLTRW